MLDCIEIIKRFYLPGTRPYGIMVEHGRRVAQKALMVADLLSHLKPDREFIYESAMLHDIGMIYTRAPRLGCTGHHPYIAHGILGRAMLEKLTLHRHSLVCERHIGVGLTSRDIQDQKLPLPVREMVPGCLEEKIVCYADKFFSKSSARSKEKTMEEIVRDLACHGKDKPAKFLSWAAQFEAYPLP